jgi:hypothetical protein
MLAAMQPIVDRSRATAMARLRLVVLATVGLFIGHTAVYLVQYGPGSTFARAMSTGNHDGYWLGFVIVATTGTVVLALRTVVRFWFLRSAAGQAPGPDQPDPLAAASVAPSYRAVTVSLARILVPVLILGYAIQENLEHILGHGHVLGVGALVGPENPLAIPVLTAVALVLAIIGAVVRWRIAILSGRLAAGRSRFEPPTPALTPGLTWMIGPVERDILRRPHRGRAPPEPVAAR